VDESFRLLLAARERQRSGQQASGLPMACWQPGRADSHISPAAGLAEMQFFAVGNRDGSPAGASFASGAGSACAALCTGYGGQPSPVFMSEGW
jgi:hypothetical protein